MASPKQGPAYAEPEYAKSDKKKTDYPWYSQNIDKYLVPETQQLLETYSKVPRDQQSQHIHETRDQAWAIRSYPCTGLGVYLVPSISLSPAYATILERLHAGATFMDVGCFLGGDMRRLAFEGAPTGKFYGIDIVSHWDVGFDLYRDRGRFDAHFIEADILSQSPGLEPLKGTFDIISISAVLHQWSWKDQLEAVKKLIAFTKPGTLVLGYQIGNIEAKGVSLQTLQPALWHHNPESFVKLWNEAGTETGTVWETKATLHSFEDMGWDPADQAWLENGARVLNFVVTRTQ